MSKIEVYAFEDGDGNEDEYTTQDPAEARRYALQNGRRWLARIHEFGDTELVEDYTGAEDEEGSNDESL